MPKAKLENKRGHRMIQYKQCQSCLSGDSISNTCSFSSTLTVDNYMVEMNPPACFVVNVHTQLWAYMLSSSPIDNKNTVAVSMQGLIPEPANPFASFTTTQPGADRALRSLQYIVHQSCLSGSFISCDKPSRAC